LHAEIALRPVTIHLYDMAVLRPECRF